MRAITEQMSLLNRLNELYLHYTVQVGRLEADVLHASEDARDQVQTALNEALRNRRAYEQSLLDRLHLRAPKTKE